MRRGKGGRRREVGMDEWAWEQPEPWQELRLELPVRAVFWRHQRINPRAAVVCGRSSG